MKRICAVCDSSENLDQVQIANEGRSTDYRTFCGECRAIFTTQLPYIKFKGITHLSRYSSINNMIRKVRLEKRMGKQNLTLFPE